MFRVRSPYVVPIVRSHAGVRVGECANEVGKPGRCVGDRPAGSVSTAGYVVLLGAPMLGAVTGCALAGMPLAGAIALGVVGVVAVLNPGSGSYGLRGKSVCCSTDGRWEEQT
jgi:hypothetical protein